MSFLPADYTPPASTGHYMKLLKGESRFRVLSSAIVGNEYWTTDKEGKRKPVRVPMGVKINTEDLESSDGDGIKHFWAFTVIDRADGEIKILELTQKSIQKLITSLVQDEDWGDPKQYDILITRKGDGMETEYTVNPKPAKPLEKEIEHKWQALQTEGFSLEELFAGGDPFTPSKKIDPNAEINIEDIDL